MSECYFLSSLSAMLHNRRAVQHGKQSIGKPNRSCILRTIGFANACCDGVDEGEHHRVMAAQQNLIRERAMGAAEITSLFTASVF